MLGFATHFWLFYVVVVIGWLKHYGILHNYKICAVVEQQVIKTELED